MGIEGFVNVLSALILVIVLFGTLTYLKWRWHRDSVSDIQLRVIPEVGKGYTIRRKEKDGWVELPLDPNRKKKAGEKDGHMYHIDQNCIDEVPYPGGFLPGFLQSTIKQVYIHEYATQAITLRGDPVKLSSAVQYKLEHEKFTALALAVSIELEELKEKLKKAQAASLNPRLVYMGLIITAIGSSVAGYVAYNLLEILPELTAVVEKFGL